MAAAPGPGWSVIEEGLSGRTTVRDDSIEGAHKNGRRYLTPWLQSHAPIDVIILTLGTNDLKRRFFQTAPEVAMGIGCLIYDIKELSPGPGWHVPEILVVASLPMLDDLHEWSGVFEGAPTTSLRLAPEFEIQADSKEVHFFDAGSVCACDPADGFHLSGQAHHKLRLALAAEVAASGWAE